MAKVQRASLGAELQQSRLLEDVAAITSGVSLNPRLREFRDRFYLQLGGESGLWCWCRDVATAFNARQIDDDLWADVVLDYPPRLIDALLDSDDASVRVDDRGTWARALEWAIADAK